MSTVRSREVLAVSGTFSEAFRNPFPSIVPKDILAGVVADILLRLA